MKLSTLWAAYEEVRADMESLRALRCATVSQKNIGSAKDGLARQWQRRNRLQSALSEEIYSRILDIEETDNPRPLSPREQNMIDYAWQKNFADTAPAKP